MDSNNIKSEDLRTLKVWKYPQNWTCGSTGNLTNGRMQHLNIWKIWIIETSEGMDVFNQKVWNEWTSGAVREIGKSEILKTRNLELGSRVLEIFGILEHLDTWKHSITVNKKKSDSGNKEYLKLARPDIWKMQTAATRIRTSVNQSQNLLDQTEFWTFKAI